MDRHTVKWPLYKHLDLERKNAKQAEARLSLNLRRLEDICLYRVKVLTGEQRQLQKELHRLQQGITKKRLFSQSGNGVQQRPENVLRPSPQGGQKHQVPEPKLRALATKMTPEKYKNKTQASPLYDICLKDHMKSKEPWRSQSYKTACFMEEDTQAQEEDSGNPPKGVDHNKGISDRHPDQEVSTNTGEQGPGCSPAVQSGMAHADETISNDAKLKLGRDAGKQSPPNSTDSAGSFKGKATEPTFLELLAKAKNARYLRHRIPPESERLLSVGEIFGHGGSTQSRAGRACESPNPPKFLQL